MLKKVMIHISSRHTEASDDLFCYMFGENNPAKDNADEQFPTEDEQQMEIDDDQPIELSSEGVLHISPNGRVTLSYLETDLSGMEGSKTSVVFDKNNDQLITMMRSGGVNTALVFEEGNRHTCVYQTPFMPFELCVHTLKVENQLLSYGKLYLDYIIEFRGAKAEHNLFTLTITDSVEYPKSISV